MVDLTIIAAVLVILITICIFYYLRKNQVDTRLSAHVSKPASKEELLKARVKHFQEFGHSSSKSENKVPSNDSQSHDSMETGIPERVSKPATKEELSEARVKHFQGLRDKTEDNMDQPSANIDSPKQKYENADKLVDSTSKELLNPDMSSEHDVEKPTEVLLSSSMSYHNSSKQPETKPIKTLAELLSWVPGCEDFSIGRVLRRPISRDGSKPKTLVCHDMKGGYIEDRFVQGYNSDKCFTFSHWNLIDSFCYFSHSFVTIPPPCWTNAAHSHGVKMLGTVITEWDDGAAICAEVFQSIAHVDRVVNILVDIASYYQFDGWLINIENPIDPSKIDNVCHFLTTLTDLIHKKIPESEVIWYDSVTRDGELKWQNKLCNENMIFFEACDGIFLNYNWSVGDIKYSQVMSKPNRQFDVYVGVDVFGRGCFGGGGWNTYKAMSVIREQKMSAAIFAPGWVMETLDVDKFPENDEKFWKLLTTYLYNHCVSTLPFVSTFCQGYGKKIFVCGQEICSNSWTNLSASSIQPSSCNNFYQLGPYDGMEVYMKSSGFSTDFGFNGGGSYVINGVVKPFAEQAKTVFRLFDTKISLKPLKEYFLSYSFHCSNEKVEVYAVLLFEDRPNYFLFMPPTHKSSIKYTIPTTQEGNYIEIYPIEECISCYAEFSNSHDWSTRNYKFSLENAGLLKEIRLACTTGGISNETESSNFTVRVGEIRIHNIADLSVKIPTAFNLKCNNIDIRTEGERKWLSFTLSWDVMIEKGNALPKCFDVFSSGQCTEVSDNGCVKTTNNEEYGVYIGRTYTDSLYVQDLIVPSQCIGGITLIVQGISYSEVRQNRSNAGKITLRW